MKYPLSEKEVFHYRSKPFYFITTSDKKDLTYEQMYKSFFDMKQKGFGGIVLFNKPINGFDEENYLSEDWFEMVGNAAKACKDIGFEMWINSGFDYPPGDVAGRVQKLAPHLKAKRIVMENGKPCVKDVDWGFPAFEEALSAELFIKLVYEEYKKHVGQYFGDPIKGFFSDTDNRRVQPQVLFNPDSIQRNLFPWCTDFEQTFREKYGYDIMPYIPQIIERKDIKQAVDYWEHAGITVQRWFKTQHEWLNENGLLFTGHTSDSSPFLYKDTPRTSPLTEGRFSDLQQHFDYPGTDQELYAIDGGKHMKTEFYYTPDVVWGQAQTTEKMTNFAQIRYDLRAKQAEAAAFMHGKKGVMCEMFAASNFGAEPHTLSHIAAYQLMQGVDFIVLHQYQHRFRTYTKFFAPPNFSPATMHDYSIKQLNDNMASLACLLAKGEKVFPIVLIDPTEAVWRNILRTEEYFDAFEQLNRLPYGFTICDTKNIIESDYGFKVAVVAGYELSEAELEGLKAKGITVLSEKELCKLEKLIECDVCYKGEGTPHFTRRIIDGEEFTFIANIEQTEPINGVITAYGREKKIRLYPGDVRYISATYDDIPEIYEPVRTIKLESEAQVEFDRANSITLDSFTCDGKPAVKTENDPQLDFTFTAKDELDGLTLVIPTVVKKLITCVTLDGITLYPVMGRRFDENYLLYALPTVTKGEHTLTIFKTAPFTSHDYMALEGDFDADIQSEGKSKRAWSTYNLKLFVPEKQTVAICARRKTLSIEKGWEVQGQPFYSGAVTYKLTADVKESGKYMLSFGDVRDVVDIKVNGKAYGRIIQPPYISEINLEKGENEIALTVYNSDANKMEAYLEPSGIMGGCFIEKL
ncbi:MAG: cadherin-like beta sandwich domain-containing protein [Ruminococcaceae bacterium]|nr:cadherin-like beta sandwich domain-containing protein [Oscillospiraceae bacterium]